MGVCLFVDIMASTDADRPAQNHQNSVSKPCFYLAFDMLICCYKSLPVFLYSCFGDANGNWPVKNCYIYHERLCFGGPRYTARAWP